MKKLKIGIIGCGGIANSKHMPALTSQKDKCEMVAFCDIIRERAEKAAAQYGAEGAKVYEDYHDLLADPEIDVVHVLTPNVVHCPITVAAFEAGKHVMCEKPMAATTEDAQLMIDAWKKSGKKFTIGYYDACIQRMRKIDKKSIFFLEGAKYARGARIFNRQYDPECRNWAISIHLYGASPEIKDLYPWLLKREELGVPLWLGECGAVPINDAVFYDICAHYGVAYTPWGWKTAADPNGPHGHGPVNHPLPKDWKKIQDFQMVGPRPTYEESIKIMDEFIELTKLEHCFINRDCARLAAKHPDIDLPGAAYDMWTEDGKRYYGSWELSNYLNFRLEAHTKLVWACEKALPYPKFAWYNDPNEERYDPLQDLALELAAGEYANYTVREVEKPCSVTLRGVGPCTVELSCGGESLGAVTLGEGSILKPQDSQSVTIPAGEERTVKVTVKEGTLQLKTVKFAY